VGETSNILVWFEGTLGILVNTVMTGFMFFKILKTNVRIVTASVGVVCNHDQVGSITLASVNHARFCQSRSLLSITLASVNHARFCQSRSLLSITLASVNYFLPLLRL
jgi:hypothetical protein